MLAALLTSLAIAKRAPAWRGLQAVSPELQAEKEHGRLRGAPPCVRTLYKEGQGNEATWRLGSLRYLGPTVPDGTPHHPDLQVSLRVPQATASGTLGARLQQSFGGRHVRSRFSATRPGPFYSVVAQLRSIEPTLLAPSSYYVVRLSESDRAFQNHSRDTSLTWHYSRQVTLTIRARQLEARVWWHTRHQWHLANCARHVTKRTPPAQLSALLHRLDYVARPSESEEVAQRNLVAQDAWHLHALDECAQ